MAGKRVTEAREVLSTWRHSWAGHWGAFGEPGNWSAELGRDPRVQQTSAEALPFFPVFLGLAAGIISFSQVPRESFNHVTRALIPLCVQTPSLQRHLPSGYERGTWGHSHYTAHLPPPPPALLLWFYLIESLKQAGKWG